MNYQRTAVVALVCVSALVHATAARSPQALGDPPGAITGIVGDMDGRGMPEMIVRLRQVIDQNRSRVLPYSGLTDAGGRYLVPDVPPGEYLVECLRMDGGGTSAFAPGLPLIVPGGFWPRGATKVQVASRQQTAGIEIRFPFRRVSGRILDAAGQPMQSSGMDVTGRRLAGRVYLSRAGVQEPSAGVPPDTDGRFRFDDVQPGTYVLRAILEGPFSAGCKDADCGGAAARQFAGRTVTVSGSDISILDLAMQPTATLRGRIALDGDQSIDRQTLAVTAIQRDLPWPEVRPNQDTMTDPLVHSDGTFTIGGIVAGAAITIRNPPRGWFVKSVGTETTRPWHEPWPPGTRDEIVVVLAEGTGGVKGRVLDAPVGRKPFDLVAYLFSTDERQWFYSTQSLTWQRLADVGPAPDYAFESVAPGDYYVVAITRETESRLANQTLPRDDAVVTQLRTLAPLARRITIGERQALTVDLPVRQLP